MPVSPVLAEQFSREVVAIYAEVERKLLARIAISVASGADGPDWVNRKLAEVQFLTAQARRLVAEVGDRAAAQVALDLVRAYNQGGAAAAADLAALLHISLYEAAAPIYGLPPVELLVAETMGQLTAVGERILRATADAYRQVIAESAAEALVGAQTRRQASQQALNRFAQRGITGFVDRAGRGWQLTSYVEMAMRTATGKAAVAGNLDRLQMFGQDLVIVSDAPKECPLCRPWEGRVLSISGKDPNQPTVEQARSAGLHHPACRHSLSLYQPGVTRPRGETADPAGYANAQKLRYLERQVRASKRMEVVAIDEQAKKAAAARVRNYQQQIRDHVNATGAKRLRYREQIGGAI